MPASVVVARSRNSPSDAGAATTGPGAEIAASIAGTRVAFASTALRSLCTLPVDVITNAARGIARCTSRTIVRVVRSIDPSEPRRVTPTRSGTASAPQPLSRSPPTSAAASPPTSTVSSSPLPYHVPPMRPRSVAASATSAILAARSVSRSRSSPRAAITEPVIAATGVEKARTGPS